MLSRAGAAQSVTSSRPPSPSGDPSITNVNHQQSGHGTAASDQGVGASMQRGKEESTHDLDRPMPTTCTAPQRGAGFDAIKSAIQLGDMTAVQAAISDVPDINAVDSNGDTLLSIAAESGKLEIVKVLRDGGARIDSEAQGVAAARSLRSASLSGHADKVAAWIAAGVRVDEPNKNGASALLIAAQNGQLDVVKLLMAANANVGCRNLQGNSALSLAALGGHLSVVRELRPVAQLQRDEFTAHLPALRRAVDANDHKVAVALIHAGVDLGVLYGSEIQADMVQGYMRGSQGGPAAIVSALDATVRAGRTLDATLVAQAAANHAMIVAAAFGKAGLTEALRLAGASIPAGAAFHAERALRDAARTNLSDNVRAWIATGVNVNALNEDRVSALMFACLLPSTDILNQLINAGADLNLADRDGETALIYAAKSGNVQAASVLCEQEAELDVPDLRGMRAFQWAVVGGHLGTADRLLEAGAQVSAQDMARTALRMTPDVPGNAISDAARIMLAATRATASGLHFLANQLGANVMRLEQNQVFHSI